MSQNPLTALNERECSCSVQSSGSLLKCLNGRDPNWQLIVASAGCSVSQPQERSVFNAFPRSKEF